MSKSMFRMLVGANLVLLVALGPVGVALIDTLPAQLRSFVIAESETTFGPITYFGLGVIVAFIVAYIGLMLFARWARTLLVVCIICGAAITLFYGPYVTTGIESSITEVGAVLDGAILVLAYYSPLRMEFGGESV